MALCFQFKSVASGELVELPKVDDIICQILGIESHPIEFCAFYYSWVWGSYNSNKSDFGPSATCPKDLNIEDLKKVEEVLHIRTWSGHR